MEEVLILLLDPGEMGPQVGMAVALEVVVAAVVRLLQTLRPVLAEEAEMDLFVCFLGKEQK